MVENINVFKGANEDNAVVTPEDLPADVVSSNMSFVCTMKRSNVDGSTHEVVRIYITLI